MSEKITVVIVEDNEPSRELLAGMIETDPEIEIVGLAGDGEEGYALLKEKQPDVILLDLIMPMLDGLDFMDKLNQDFTLRKRPNVIIISAVSDERFTTGAFDRGADYFIRKPYRQDAVISRIKQAKKNKIENKAIETTIQIREQKGNHDRHEVESRISDMMIELGIAASLKGYGFIRESIILAVNDPNVLASVTKTLYPMIGERFNTTKTRVERNMRSAIEHIGERGNLEYIRTLFGYVPHKEKGSLTNSEFIAIVSDRIRLEMAQKRSERVV